MTHTPGPAESQAIEIFRVLAKQFGPEKVLNVLAAAPDLLEALEEVMAWIDNWYPPFCEDDEWPDTNAKVVAAIAKARGQS